MIPWISLKFAFRGVLAASGLDACNFIIPTANPAKHPVMYSRFKMLKSSSQDSPVFDICQAGHLAYQFSGFGPGSTIACCMTSSCADVPTRSWISAKGLS